VRRVQIRNAFAFLAGYVLALVAPHMEQPTRSFFGAATIGQRVDAVKSAYIHERVDRAHTNFKTTSHGVPMETDQ
jgi:hypothetical protein